MTNSSKAASPRQVPPPAGQKPTSAYARFIPREELQGFAAWTPDAIGAFGATAGPGAGADAGTAPGPAAEAATAEPPSAEVMAQLQAARQAGYQDG
jgi:flagellar assembly protein FliH